MVIKFNYYDWRSMMKACGSIAKLTEREDSTTKYLHMRFYDNRCTVFGASGFQFTRYVIPCDMGNDSYMDVTLLVSPEKMPAGTRKVEMHIDPGKMVYSIIYLDDLEDVLATTDHDFPEDVPIDIEKIYKRILDNTEHYFIVVDPKKLIAALEGLKSADKVILNFGTQVQPFLIRPYGGDQEELVAGVFPVRP